MSHRFYFAPLFSLALVATLSGQTTPAPAAKHQPSAIARAPDGHPDLQGTWTNVTLTPMARPPQFNGKLNLTDAEAAVYENHQTEELKSADGKADAEFHRRAGSGETGCEGGTMKFRDDQCGGRRRAETRRQGGSHAPHDLQGTSS